MSSKKYVPDRLRGVLGGNDANSSTQSSTRSSSSRGKGKKSRPWRVDAASWKQQLQERKAVYDNFALHEKGDEEKKELSPRATAAEELEAIPLNILTSAKNEADGQVDTMLTPDKGEQVQTVFNSPPKTSSPPSSLARNDQNLGRSSPSKKRNPRKLSPGVVNGDVHDRKEKNVTSAQEERACSLRHCDSGYTGESSGSSGFAPGLRAY